MRLLISLQVLHIGGDETWRSSWSFLEVDSGKRVIDTLENLMK